MKKCLNHLGNFVLVHDIIKKHNPQVLRFFMLSVHYRNPINYSEELLESTKAAFERLTTSYQNLKHRKEASTDLTDTNQEWLEKIAKSQEEFIEAMDDDFNTAKAISVLFDLSKLANYYLLEKNTAVEVIDAFTKQFEELFHVLGLTI